MDISRALADAENALRDFIAATLSAKWGESWIDSCGASENRVKTWQERKEVEAKRQESGVVEERLIYYADFYDLRSILKKNWQDFAAALGEWRTMEVFLKELERLRDPDAHRRELLPHQKHLALGLSGEIRNRIVRYRSSRQSEDDFFPKLESVRDSLGNIWVPSGEESQAMQSVSSDYLLHPGDQIDYVVTATDPEEADLEYGLRTGTESIDWQKDNTLSLRISEGHIRRSFYVEVLIRSLRAFHASGARHDDKVTFYYRAVLPKAE